MQKVSLLRTGRQTWHVLSCQFLPRRLWFCILTVGNPAPWLIYPCSFQEKPLSRSLQRGEDAQFDQVRRWTEAVDVLRARLGPRESLHHPQQYITAGGWSVSAKCKQGRESSYITLLSSIHQFATQSFALALPPGSRRFTIVSGIADRLRLSCSSEG